MVMWPLTAPWEGKKVSGNVLGSEESNRKLVFSSPRMGIKRRVAPGAAGSCFLNTRKTNLKMKPKFKTTDWKDGENLTLWWHFWVTESSKHKACSTSELPAIRSNKYPCHLSQFEFGSMFLANGVEWCADWYHWQKELFFKYLFQISGLLLLKMDNQ